MRLPPINSLRAFEAAARHCSFTRAGEELHVSPGAISRFVKLLEDDLEVKLFERMPNGLRLTGKGKELRPRLTKAFSDIEDAIAQASQRSDEIKILLPETLGLRLLLRKISEYNEAGLGPKVRCGVEFKDWDSYFSGDFDLGVCCFMGLDNRPETLEFRFLRPEVLAPMCSPKLLESEPVLKELRDLEHFELLHSYTDKSDWMKWLAAAHVDNVDWQSGQTFLSMEFAVKAAVEGLGVVIGDLTLFEDELRRGDLVTPFDFALTENTGYFIFGKPERLEDPDVAAVCRWLLKEAGSGTQHEEARSRP